MMSDKQSEEPRIGIVAVGYNRLGSLERLLTRLNACDYPCSDVHLVISLDNCGSMELAGFAERFTWEHGPKTVVLQPERLGLRRHILKCGTYMTEFGWDAQIVLEDDVYPAGAFYEYSLQAVKKYRDDDRIAGIALFGLPLNQSAHLPFKPSLSRYDAYFVQLAQSCGQVWMRRQWDDFVRWYENRPEPFVCDERVPFNVRRWPETSWLKYHICYCVENDKWFSYPYQSLTTNFSDIGSNTNVRSNILQTRLQNEAKEAYEFPDLDGDAVRYDAWCENTELYRTLGLSADELCVDIAGAKGSGQGRRYWLTTLSAPYRIVKSFALQLMPMDMNVLCGLPGHEIFLYDTASAGEAPAVGDRDLSIWAYYNRLFYPDPAIMKLARRMENNSRKNRLRLLLHPGKLFKKLWKRIKGK